MMYCSVCMSKFMKDVTTHPTWSCFCSFSYETPTSFSFFEMFLDLMSRYSGLATYTRESGNEDSGWGPRDWALKD